MGTRPQVSPPAAQTLIPSTRVVYPHHQTRPPNVKDVMTDRGDQPDSADDAAAAHRGPARDRHVPVMRDRILELLAPALEREGSVHVDATLGMGGHAEGVLDHFPGTAVVGIDRDH